ncbi:hypothetical protein [Ferrovibrio sp.]|uniref:hypothetical protein n=1 Tax=Ferrovibrio sp. TaxID=1917215 RepID=UPI0035AFFD70
MQAEIFIANPSKNVAAGAFQFIDKTWNRNAKEVDVNDLSKDSQDRLRRMC